ncbi:MAG: hypothetical protein AAB299_01330, partial [Thermodesulfobacteriota bacterium]
ESGHAAAEQMGPSGESGISPDSKWITPFVIDPEVFWSCTTCRACEEACPVGIEFVDRIGGGVIPGQYRPAVEKGIVEAMAEGVVAGYPVVDLRVSLTDGSYHTVDSSEMAFKIAGSLGFKKGVLECQPTLLEPIVNISIEIPDEYMGDVIGDLNSRRGKVLGMDSFGHHQIIKGQVPRSEILKYAPDLRSMTSGRGTFTYEHSHYEEVPSYIAEKIIAESKKEAEG